MRAVGLIVVVVLALVFAADTADAQFRGRLSSRPSVSSVTPRPAGPLHPIPAWWQWGLVALPEPVMLTQPPFGDGAPKGGVQLDIQPWSAHVYVDGALVGRVEQFRGYYQHLELPAGPHTIAIAANDREPLILGVLVLPGRVITQRATLSWAGASVP